jgi:hypothetical protein
MKSKIGPTAGVPGGLYFSMRCNQPLRDNKGSIVFNAMTARVYRRAYSGVFGKEAKTFQEIMSK